MLEKRFDYIYAVMIKTLLNFTEKGYRIFDSIRNSKIALKKDKIAAIKALQLAINKTRIFLDNDTSDRSRYIANGELSELWLKSFETIQRFDPDLAASLRYKSNFWANPRLWLNEPSSMKLVPKLRDLDESAEQLLIELNS